MWWRLAVWIAVLSVAAFALSSVAAFSLKAAGEAEFARQERRESDAFGLGKEAAAAGVPADANPYRGSSQTESVAWLRGWMEGKSRERGRPGGD